MKKNTSALSAGVLFFLAVFFCLWPFLSGIALQRQSMFIYLFGGWALLIGGLFCVSQTIKKQNNSQTRSSRERLH